MKKNKKNIIILSVIAVVLILIIIALIVINKNVLNTTKVDLTNLTYKDGKETEDIKKYTGDDFQDFLEDYQNNKLPSIYVTEFLFDGVSQYKPYDLDDFIENGNDYDIEALKITTININTTGNIELSGELKGGMIAVNTNDISKDINIILNGVNVDTDSKKVPAIYVYNKDINYTNHKVTIKLASNSKNYINGGKLKKVSLVGSDELNNYSSKYSGTNKENYEKYNNYYGVYTSDEINNILFAKIEASNEKLRDGDPYYFYKASGAISSDIDLYFEGDGYLEVKSNKKEGIETKGNLTLGDGKGDYVVYALDDCLNTTTSMSYSSNVRNTLTVNVNSLTAIVLDDADEGDALDSNGKLVVDGGTIIALSHPGSDSGLDSDNGIYINGGRVISIGDMYDEVSSDSKQNFMLLSFNERINSGDLITLLDEKDNVVFSFKTDRTYSNLVYSSKDLKNGTYYLYKNGDIEGTDNNGFYTSIDKYTKGTQLAYSNKGNIGRMMGGGQRPNDFDDDNQEDRRSNRPSENNEDMTPPDDDFKEKNKMNNDNNERPDMPDKNGFKNDFSPDGINNTTATNKEFKIEEIANLFSGVATYSE